MTATVIAFPSRKRTLRPPPPAPELTLEECRAEVERAMAEHPALNVLGYGIEYDRRHSPEERLRRLAEARAELLTDHSIDGVMRARSWLSKWPRTKNINPAAGSSYGLKHAAEPTIKYVTNGEFVAAAIILGFKIEGTYYGQGPNVWINITARAARGSQQ